MLFCFAQTARKISALHPSDRSQFHDLYIRRSQSCALTFLTFSDRNSGGGRVWPATARCAHGGNRQSGAIPDHFRIRTGKIERVDDVRYVFTRLLLMLHL